MPGRDEETGQFVPDSGQKAPTEEKFDRTALEASVADRLAATFAGETDETPADETEETSAEETQETQEEVSDNADGAEDEATSDNDTETEEDGAAATPPANTGSKAPTLPDAYRRSLKAYDWTDEEIDANLKTLGASFIATAQKIHTNRNTELAAWAAQGRAARQQQQNGQQQEQETEQPAARTSKPAASKKALKPIDTAKLKEHYGDDELIDALAGQINPVIEQINEILPRIEATQRKSTEAELDKLGRVVEDFFASDEIKPYTEFYGDGKKQFTDEQLQARNKVLETADALALGAKMQGRNLSVVEAMQLAHDSVSSTYKVKAARDGIAKSLKQRNKGITLKPGNKGSAKDTGVIKTRDDLEKKVKASLNKVFGNK